MRSFFQMLFKGYISVQISILSAYGAQADAPILNKSDAKAIVTYAHAGCLNANVAAVVHGVAGVSSFMPPAGTAPHGGDVAAILVICTYDNKRQNQAFTVFYDHEVGWFIP